MTNRTPSILVVGAGASTGASLCREFAGDHNIGLVARSTVTTGALAEEFNNCIAIKCDVGDQSAWADALSEIEAQLGLPDVIVFNTEGGGMGDYASLDPGLFDDSFSINVTSLLVMAQTWFPKYIERQAPLRLIINSSPAAYEPSTLFTGLGPSRAAQRFLGEILAESTEGSDIRLALLSINGAIDAPKMRSFMPDRPDNGFIRPSAIAAFTRHLAEMPDLSFHHEISPEDPAYRVSQTT